MALEHGRHRHLAAARRLDWRFLLADPLLGDVVYVGRRKDELIAACAAFAETLVVVEAGAAPPARAQADVVVAVDPRRDELRDAAARLRAGGWLYVELSGFAPAAVRHARRPSLPRRCMQALEELEFEDVRAHWHWPTFVACTEIVPLAEREALGQWLIRRQADGSRAKALVAKLLLALRAQTLLSPATSVVGRQRLGTVG